MHQSPAVAYFHRSMNVRKITKNLYIYIQNKIEYRLKCICWLTLNRFNSFYSKLVAQHREICAFFGCFDNTKRMAKVVTIIRGKTIKSNRFIKTKLNRIIEWYEVMLSINDHLIRQTRFTNQSYVKMCSI